MVSDRCVGPRRDRAQLILIGAITLAFIILGLVVVVNGVLFAETLAPGASSQSGSEAATVEHELEAGVAGIAHRGNLEWDDEYDSTLENVIDDSYAERYRNGTANSRPVIVDVEFDGKGQTAAVRTDRSVSSIGTLLPTATNIGHLAFQLEATGSGEITIDDGSQGREITITDTGSGFTIEDGDGNDCDVRDDRASINVVSGEINVSTGSDCTFNTIDPSETSTASITENDIEGTYDLVVKDDGVSGVNYDYTDRAWTVDVTVTYDSSDVSYERPHRVFLYGDRS